MIKEADLILKEKAKQFPLDEIINEKDRLVKGWMSVETVDKAGEIIPVSEFKKTMATMMKRGAPIQDSHSNRPVGKILNYTEKKHEESGKQGIEITYQIYDDYSVDDEVWKEIKDGKRSLSFGGRALKEPEVKQDKDAEGGTSKTLRGIEAFEVGSVTDPCNEFATNTAVNFLAKSNGEKTNDSQERLSQAIYRKPYGELSDDQKLKVKESIKDSNKLLSDLQKGYAGEILKPFSGFADFDSCVSEQKKKGHDDDSAKRICGFLQAKSEKKGKYKKKVCPNCNYDLDKAEESEYGPHGHDEENPTGLHSHKNYKKMDNLNKKINKLNKDIKLSIINKDITESIKSFKKMGKGQG